MLYLLLVNNIKMKHCMLIMIIHCFLTNTPEEGHYENHSYYYKKNFKSVCHQQTRDIQLMFAYCWASVKIGGQISSQNWFNVMC